MPELPEVETIVRELKKELEGKTIIKADAFSEYKTFPPKDIFIKTLLGCKIKTVSRIAKVIAIEINKNILKEDIYLVFHLAMTGRLLYKNPKDKSDSHMRVSIKFDDGNELRFTDVRMFGYCKILSGKDLQLLKDRYGPTPFSTSLNGKTFLDILKRRKTVIKKALLDQEVVSGIGNIYANDSLWMSQIHPETPTAKLNVEQADKLLGALKEILSEGIKHKGSTLDDLMYVDIYGNIGEHQNYFRVYGKNGQPCKRCKTKIETIHISGRSTFFCPSCQKLDNGKTDTKQTAML